MAGNGVKVSHFQQFQFSLFGLIDNGLGQGMFGFLLAAGSNPENLIFIMFIKGHKICHPGLSLGQCAGLVKDDKIDFAEILEGLRKINKSLYYCGSGS